MDNVEQLDDEKLRMTIANNLVKYRKNAKMTQIEFAEKLLYSDKNVSRWERGEATPDIFVLKKIADLYSISVNDLLEETKEIVVQKPIKEKRKKTKFLNKKQLLITLLSVFCVWLVATACFFVMESFTSLKGYGWQCFIVAFPISVIVTLVFTAIWCTNFMNAIVVTFLIWSVAVAVFICIPYDNNWLIFILAIPVQILDILWFTLRKVNYNIFKNNNIKKATNQKKEIKKD